MNTSRPMTGGQSRLCIARGETVIKMSVTAAYIRWRLCVDQGRNTSPIYRLYITWPSCMYMCTHFPAKHVYTCICRHWAAHPRQVAEHAMTGTQATVC